MAASPNHAHYYVACSQCNNDTSMTPFTYFHCLHCNQEHMSTMSYKLPLLLTDGTATLTTVFFGHDAEQLISHPPTPNELIAETASNRIYTSVSPSSCQLIHQIIQRYIQLHRSSKYFTSTFHKRRYKLHKR